MPILPAEPDRFPSHLFDPSADPADGSRRAWWVLHTKPRQEKSLARQLSAAGIAFYLPAVPRRLQVRGRALTSHMPLFTGYLFLLADRDERVAALASNRVVQSLPVHDQQRLWSDLRQVERLLSLGAPVHAEASLAPGTPVEITTGPLAGLCGTVVRCASGRRFVVRVDFIQQGASVLLEDCALLPLRREGAAVP
jgi:transcription antitermination factor NusG